MAASREGAARQQTEWLGAAEERKLFAADTMAACMHWPPGYSLNSADWSTESFDSFQRPVTPRPDRRPPPAASEVAAQQIPSTSFLFRPEPEDEVGLFSAEVFPSRLHSTWRNRGIAPAERGPLQGAPLQGAPLQGAPFQGAPLQGAPHLHYPHAFQSSSHQLPQRQGPFPQARAQEQRQQQQQQSLYPPAAAAAAAAGQKQQSTLTSSLGGGGVEPLRGNEALAPQLNQHRGRRGSRVGRVRSRAMQGSVSDSLRSDRLIQSTASDPVKTPAAAAAAAAAEGVPATSSQSFQQLLQQQREALQQQFEGVEKLRAQLEELEGALRLLQLQQQPCSLAAAAEQQQDKLAASASLDAREDDTESQCWSLDPRDYKHLPAELLDWIPPAGLPSVRRRPSQ
ncbi:hypothetical protein Emed_001849 [Eimeria media]